jgi:dTDP-4-amino-4,6-dideoxygalactose transaminase
VRLLEEAAGSPCVFHLFPIRVPDRELVATRLREDGIATGIHYSPPAHRQPALAGAGRESGDLAVAAQWAAQELSLPMFAELTDAEVDRVVEACHEAVYDLPVLEPPELIGGVGA